MNYSIEKGYGVLRASTQEESRRLHDLALIGSEVRQTIKHKKHKFKKECPICHKMFKGLKIHTAIAHSPEVPADVI